MAQLDISKADPILHCVSEDNEGLELVTTRGRPAKGESHVSVTKAFKRLATWIVNILNWVLGAAFFKTGSSGAEVKGADLCQSEKWE